MSDKERLDVLMVNNGLAASRELAKAYIMAGDVYVDGNKEDKAGTKIDVASKIELRGREMPYVSRGGYKLEKAIEVFPVELSGKTCMDIGASTGGFTDCMLQNEAAKVYAIDVGYGQLAWKLRNDERVVCMEKTNVRYITEEQIPDKPSFASVDVSFISLTKVIPPAINVMSGDAQMVCLIKPQFEAGREKVGKKGVVREKSTHLEVILNIIDFVFGQGLNVIGIDFSPIKGPEGNIEYLIMLDRKNTGMTIEEARKCAKDITDASHELL
ncbi:MAG: TlyA family RNA methyltransferase [Clostridiales bacterium]|nr:TlyA family RNA methyltransferase [Clostridiales bacterium]